MFFCRLQWRAADTEKALEAEIADRSEVTGQLEEVIQWLKEQRQALQEVPQSFDPDELTKHTATAEVGD